MIDEAKAREILVAELLQKADDNCMCQTCSAFHWAADITRRADLSPARGEGGEDVQKMIARLHTQSLADAYYKEELRGDTLTGQAAALIESLSAQLAACRRGVEQAAMVNGLLMQRAEKAEAELAACREALLYWRNECSGNDPSLSVFNRMVDAAIDAARKP